MNLLKNRNFLIGVLTLVAAIVICFVLPGGETQDPSKTATSEATSFSNSDGSLATQTVQPTATVTVSSPALGEPCGYACIWSRLCVDLGRMEAEQGGMARAIPGSPCVSPPNVGEAPVWIPQLGDSCGTDCVWSAQCVKEGFVAEEIVTLARVYSNSCQSWP